MMRKLVLIVSSMLLLAFISGNRSEYSIPVRSNSIHINNLDMDGDNDILIGHKTAWEDTNNTITILDNVSKGIFEMKDTSMVFSGYQENIFTINVDSNDSPDIIALYSDFASGEAERYVRIYYNDGSGNYTSSMDISLNTSTTLSNINHGDVNGDGFEDIIVVSNKNFFIGVLYNNGNGSFDSPQYFGLTFPPMDICCGDLDNNGKDDIVIGGSNLAVYYSFQNGFEIWETNHSGYSVEITDYNNDGLKDIVSATLGDYLFIKVAENLGGGMANFEFMDIRLSQINTFNFITSDLNLDELPDLIFTSLSEIYVLYNTGGYYFNDPLMISIPTYWEDYRRSASADLDNNGYPDIVTIRYHYWLLPSNLNIKFNDGEGNFVNDPITSTNQTLSHYKNDLECYPNPFKDDVSIEFKIKNRSDVEVSVYSIKGNLIKKITKNYKKGGKHTLKWRGLDEAGKACKPGAYIAYLKVNGEIRQSMKIIKTK